jgi:CRISPR/Cas system CSM-associated protein Csm2 small subunit
MSCERTYERYDEDEYFMIFLRIHPYLYYHHESSEISHKKFEIQCKLLTQIDANEITTEKAKQIYGEISLKIQANKQKMAEVICFHKKFMDAEIKNKSIFK